MVEWLAKLKAGTQLASTENHDQICSRYHTESLRDGVSSCPECASEGADAIQEAFYIAFADWELQTAVDIQMTEPQCPSVREETLKRIDEAMSCPAWSKKTPAKNEDLDRSMINNKAKHIANRFKVLAKGGEITKDEEVFEDAAVVKQRMRLFVFEEYGLARVSPVIYAALDVVAPETNSEDVRWFLGKLRGRILVAVLQLRERRFEKMCRRFAFNLYQDWRV